MRIHHYIKNLLVFAPLVFSIYFFELDKLYAGVMGFLSFCMLSSAVYILNDIFDVEKDKTHPTKCKRPIACGDISVKSAWILAAVFCLGSFLLNGLIFYLPATLLLLLYFILNLAYSLGLKNIPIIDIAILVCGFLIRIIYGAYVTDIPISNWFYLTILALMFYFALGKRRNELIEMGSISREVLKAYPVNFLDKNMTISMTLANAFYALWCMDAKTIAMYNKNIIFTVPIVFLITMKYSFNIESSPDGDPVEVLLHDKGLLALTVLYIVFMFIFHYI